MIASGPIVTSAFGRIIMWHQRLRAARERGFKKGLVRYLS
jgi:hypothetical protein